MAQSVYDKYLEAEIAAADPVKLVLILFRAALESVSAARRHLQQGEIRERSRKITRAWEILSELLRSLDRKAGGDISRNLAELYVYMQSRLLAANAEQSDAPLAEVESLLRELTEAWKAVPNCAPPPVRAAEYAPVSCSY
jgi:flagellar protein FliS